MQVDKQFAPITILIETKEELKEFTNALGKCAHAHNSAPFRWKNAFDDNDTKEAAVLKKLLHKLE